MRVEDSSNFTYEIRLRCNLSSTLMSNEYPIMNIIQNLHFFQIWKISNALKYNDEFPSCLNKKTHSNGQKHTKMWN